MFGKEKNREPMSHVGLKSCSKGFGLMVKRNLKERHSNETYAKKSLNKRE